MEAMLERAAVIEIGAYHTKVGFAGEPGPRHIVNTPTRLASPGVDSTESDRGYHKFLRRVFFNLLQVNPTDTPVFILDGLFTPDGTRDTLIHSLLAKLFAPSVTPIPHPLAAVHAAGLDHGLVVDVGHSCSSCIAVADGAPLYHTAHTTPAAAASVDRMLSEAHPDLDADAVADLKSLVCCVPRHPDAMTAPEGPYRPSENVRLRGQYIECAVAASAPEKALFLPENSDSVAEIVLQTLLAAPRELRPSLATHIILCGGGTMLPGFEARLRQELEVLVSSDDRFSRLVEMTDPKTRQQFCVAPVVFEPNCVGWAGGSLLGSVKGVNWGSCGRVTKEQYMSASKELGSVPKSLMPCWNDLHHNQVLEDVSTRNPMVIPHKASKWQVR